MKRRNFLGALASLPLFGLVAPKEEAKKPKWNKKPVDMVFEDNHWKPHVDATCFCQTQTNSGLVVELVGEYVVEPGQHNRAPVGVLLDDVVDVDIQHINIFDYNGSTQIGGKVSILTKGWIVARCKGNPQPGEIAYYDSQGWITNKSVSKPIGHFSSTKDEEGFAKVRIQI
jgi:hypothetical protein